MYVNDGDHVIPTITHADITLQLAMYNDKKVSHVQR